MYGKQRKYIFILWVIALPFFGFAQPLKIISSTSKHWAAGVRGGGSGTTYNILLKSNSSSQKITFKGIWVADKYFSVHYVVLTHSSKTRKDNDLHFDKNDTLRISFTDFEKGERIPDDSNHRIMAEPDTIPQIKPPFTYKGEALISYIYKKKKQFLMVEKFEKLKQEAYP